MDQTIVIGVGNPLMGDDGAGPWVASTIASLELPGVNTVTLITPGYDLISHFQDMASAVIVDAAEFDGAPGDIRRLEWGDNALRKAAQTSGDMTMHGIDLQAVLEKASQLGMLPGRVSVFCVRCGRIEPTDRMTGPVREACERVVSLVVKELRD